MDSPNATADVTDDLGEDEQQEYNSTSPRGVFDAIEIAFQVSATPPRPLAVFGPDLDGRLPAREVTLPELRHLMLDRAIGPMGHDAVWREMIYRSRGLDDPTAWRLGALGLALPGLRAEAGRLTHEFGPLDGDIEQDLITMFLDAFAAIDPGRRHLITKLMDAVKKVGIRMRYIDAPLPLYREDIRCMALPPRLPWRHPEMVLIDAIVKEVLSEQEAEIIARTRLEHVPVPVLAHEIGDHADAVRQRRHRAEHRLVRAIGSGKVRASLTPPAA